MKFSKVFSGLLLTLLIAQLIIQPVLLVEVEKQEEPQEEAKKELEPLDESGEMTQYEKDQMESLRQKYNPNNDPLSAHYDPDMPINDVPENQDRGWENDGSYAYYPPEKELPDDARLDELVGPDYKGDLTREELRQVEFENDLEGWHLVYDQLTFKYYYEIGSLEKMPKSIRRAHEVFSKNPADKECQGKVLNRHEYLTVLAKFMSSEYQFELDKSKDKQLNQSHEFYRKRFHVMLKDLRPMTKEFRIQDLVEDIYDGRLRDGVWENDVQGKVDECTDYELDPNGGEDGSISWEDEAMMQYEADQAKEKAQTDL